MFIILGLYMTFIQVMFAIVFSNEFYEDYEPFKDYTTWDFITKEYAVVIPGVIAVILFSCAVILFKEIRRKKKH